MIRTSESITKIAPAIVAAQADMPAVPKQTKGQVGNQVRYYADFSTVVEAVQPILAKHGLAFVQLPIDTDRQNHVGLTTRIVHTSGEWIEASFAMPSQGNGAQGIGSALSYAKRYALMAAFGLATEDDDGAGASAPPPRQQQAPRQSAPKPAAPKTDEPSVAQIQAMMAAFNGIGVRDKDERIEFIRNVVNRPVDSSKELTKAEAGQVIDAINKQAGATGAPDERENP